MPVIVEEIPEGRQRGKLVYLKEGLFFCVRDFDLAPGRVIAGAARRLVAVVAHAIDAPPSRAVPTAGKFGFIRPRDAKSKDDHAFFNMNELCAFVCARASPVDAIAATAPLRRRPKLKLKLGDYLEYTPATGEPKNGAPGKPRAKSGKGAAAEEGGGAASLLWPSPF